jgi:RND family efflux transporter MFP subunit
MTDTRKNTTSAFARLAGVLTLAAAVMLLGSSAMAAAQSPSSGLERGMTKPKSEPKLAFYGPGLVAKVLVEEGQEVKAGQPLAEQDMREEDAKLLSLQGELLSAHLQIEAANADVKQKRVALKRKQELYADVIARGGSNTELEEAQVAVEIGDIAVKFRTQEMEQKKLEIKAVELKKQMRVLTSPIDGWVSKIDVKAGEGTDLSKPAITVIQHATLHVEIDVPAAKAKRLAKGQTLQVCYFDDFMEDPRKVTWMPATVTFLTPYANAGAGTRKVRLTMENKGMREAGLSVYVQLPDNAPAGGAVPAAAAAK